MTRYLVTIHHPTTYDPAAAEDDAMARDIDALNDEMVAAGVRMYGGMGTQGRHRLPRPGRGAALPLTPRSPAAAW